MLSRKQQWKRVCMPIKKHYSSDNFDNISSTTKETYSELSEPTQSIFEMLFSQPPRKIKKSVSFNTSVNVTLIPASCEYKQANLHHQIWYSEKDLEEIKQRTIQELVDSKYKTVKEFMDAKYKTI